MRNKILNMILAIILSSSYCLVAQNTTSVTVQKKDSVFYTCSMHPEINSNIPCNCPKCGMVLSKISFSDEKKKRPHKMKKGCGMMDRMGDMNNMENMPVNSQNLNAVSDSTKVNSVIYTCTMHPNMKSNQPGNCPKCGMQLTVIKNQ